MDPLATLCTQNRVSLQCKGTDPTWANFTFRQAILCDAASDHYLGFPKVNFRTLLSKPYLYFRKLLLGSTIVSLIKTKSSACSNSPSTPFMFNSVKVQEFVLFSFHLMPVAHPLYLYRLSDLLLHLLPHYDFNHFLHS